MAAMTDEERKAYYREQARKRREKYPEKAKAYARKWRSENVDRARQLGRESRARNHDKATERQRRWYQENKEVHLEKGKKYRQANKRDIRNAQLQRIYGISMDDYDRMLAQQGGVCALCAGPPHRKSGSFDVDHDHTTGRVRGLLCRLCNVGLGHFKDSAEILRRAIDYVTVG